jgi:hypothetical protein
MIVFKVFFTFQEIGKIRKSEWIDKNSYENLTLALWMGSLGDSIGQQYKSGNIFTTLYFLRSLRISPIG